MSQNADGTPEKSSSPDPIADTAKTVAGVRSGEEPALKIPGTNTPPADHNSNAQTPEKEELDHNTEEANTESKLYKGN